MALCEGNPFVHCERASASGFPFQRASDRKLLPQHNVSIYDVFQIDITALAMETAHGAGQKTYDDYMMKQGYFNYKHIDYTEAKVGLYVDDTIFVKKNLSHRTGIVNGVKS